jgi:hypothetical protein
VHFACVPLVFARADRPFPRSGLPMLVGIDHTTDIAATNTGGLDIVEESAMDGIIVPRPSGSRTNRKKRIRYDHEAYNCSNGVERCVYRVKDLRR